MQSTGNEVGVSSGAMQAGKPEALTIYDASTDQERLATQRDIDRLRAIVQMQYGVLVALKRARELDRDALPASVNTALEIYDEKRLESFR